MTTPLLILSDSPSGQTGFSRITRDLATRIHANMQDVFRVGVLGFGGNYSRQFGFPQYHTNTADGMPVPELPAVWKDFAGDEPGILFPIWNASWVTWLTHAERLPPSPIRTFLLDNPPFKKWGYFPVDGWTPNYKLHRGLYEVFNRFDRVLAYTPTAAHVMSHESLDVENIPHGIDTRVFAPADEANARLFMAKALCLKGEIPGSTVVIGCVATNSQRKDWPLFFATAALLVARGLSVLLWAHTDAGVRHWDMAALARIYGVEEFTYITTGNIPDAEMAVLYSACDVTLGIGSGEGFGYPIFESIACGTPCIHGDYGCAPDFLPAEYLVEPKRMILDGVWMNQRPVYDPEEWADRVQAITYGRPQAKLPPELDWDNAWKRWEQWLRGN